MTTRRLALAVIAIALVVPACSSGGKGGAPFTVTGSPVMTNTIDLPKSLKFFPQVIDVSAGTTVTWTNHDNFAHNVALVDGSGIVKDLPIGRSATITFSKPGTVLYRCTIHPQMHGKVIVSP